MVNSQRNPWRFYYYILRKLKTNTGACLWIWILRHDDETVQYQVIGISILLGACSSAHLIFSMSMIANLLGTNIGKDQAFHISDRHSVINNWLISIKPINIEILKILYFYREQWIRLWNNRFCQKYFRGHCNTLGSKLDAEPFKWQRNFCSVFQIYFGFWIRGNVNIQPNSFANSRV